MATRTYNINITAVNSEVVNYSAWITDGWMSLKAARFVRPNKEGQHWNFDNSQKNNGNYYKRTSLVTHLEKGLNYAMEKLVDLQDGLNFDVTVSDDPYDRPVVENVTVVAKKSKGTHKPQSTEINKEDAVAAIRDQIMKNKGIAA